MLIDYWSINGFGLNININIIDKEKYANILGTDSSNITNDFDVVDSSEVIENFDIIIEKTLGQEYVEVFGINTRGNAGNEIYLCYFPCYPWRIKNIEKKFSETEIKRLIYEILKPILKNNVTKAGIYNEIDYITSYGCN